MALERTYTIPLRKEWLKSPKYKRAKKAVNTVKSFLKRHMKAEEKNIRIGKHLNLALWEHGIKNPPHKIRITAVKDDAGVVRAEIVGAPKEEIPAPEKKPEKKKEEAPKAPEKKPAEEKKEKPVAEKKTLEKPVEKKAGKKAEKKEEKPEAATEKTLPAKKEEPKTTTEPEKETKAHEERPAQKIK